VLVSSLSISLYYVDESGYALAVSVLLIIHILIPGMLFRGPDSDRFDLLFSNTVLQSFPSVVPRRCR
jgi:hypothetical protein